MALENIITSVNFSVKGGKATACTVVMYHHVVNPEDFRMRTGFGFDFFYELRIRCGSDYVIFVFIQNFQSGNKYEYCDCRSYITVEVNSRKMRNKQCNKYRTG